MNLLDLQMFYCNMFVSLSIHQSGKFVVCNEVIFVDLEMLWFAHFVIQ